jgi:chaperone modulatory protein CbpM
MMPESMYQGELVDEANLNLTEFASACAVECDWVVERVRSGALNSQDSDPVQWRFGSDDLLRARRLAFAELAFDANEETAALIVDLMEEVNRLRDYVSHVKNT